MKRYVCLLAAVFSLLCFTISASGAESEDVIVVVNTDLSTSGLIDGSFGAKQLPALQQDEVNISNIYVDRATGQEMKVRAAQFDPLIPVEGSGLVPQASVSAVEYTLGDETTVPDAYSGDVTTKCLYIGQYCTVWCATADPTSIRMDASHAQQVGEQFDAHCEDMMQMFGDWYDADGDGKVAIFCYDIESSYGTTINSYVAGYFYGANLISSNGDVNGIQFGTSDHAMGMDCIHLDTYPGMGYRFDSIERSYSTLFHEFQHMINFTYLVADGSYMADTEVYLNEAFSMAAEHLICGWESTNIRAQYFSSASYVPGTSMSYWDGSMSNYSNAYLFGQYVRIRYAQLTGGDGSDIYRNVMERRAVTEESAIDVIVELLQTDQKTLIKDFWAAVYKKDADGIYGFNGETWAEAITPTVLSASSDSGIYNGGAKFYTIDSAAQLPQQTSNVQIIRFTDGEVLMPPDARIAYLTLPDRGVETIDIFDNGYPWIYDETAGRFESGNPGYGDTSSVMVITFEIVAEGTLTFQYGVSSQIWSDKLTITLDDTVVADGISGKTSGTCNTALAAGTHTLMLTYEKNRILNWYDDCGWFSDFVLTVDLPPCTHTTTHMECSENGDKTHTLITTCTDCGEIVSQQIIDCIDGDKDAVCDECGGEYATITKFTMAGSNMTLGNELVVNVMFMKNKVTGEDNSIEITHGDVVTTIAQESWDSYNSAMYVARIPVAAKEMADELVVTVKNADGYEIANAYSTSVRDYAMKVLSGSLSTYNQQMKNLAVDMLNYGAAAQTNFSYNTGDMANKLLTEEQAGWETADVVCTNNQVKGAKCMGSNLSLESKILLNIIFQLTDTAAADKYAMVTYTDYTGKAVEYRVDAFNRFNASMQGVVVDEIVLADAFQLVTVTVYNADGTVYGTGSDSVESYAARTESVLNAAIMKFASAAKSFLAQ